jgi:hypothetical protein
MEAAHRMHWHLLPLLSHQMLFLCMQNQNPLVLGLLCISGCGCAIFYEYQRCSASLFLLLFLPASNCTFHFNSIFLLWLLMQKIGTLISIVVYYHLECVTAVSYCLLWLAESWFQHSCNSEKGVKNFLLIYLQRGWRYWWGVFFIARQSLVWP